MRETWYKLEDGRIVDPADVVADELGKLFHADGVAVAMKGDVPFSIGVDDPEAARAGVPLRDMRPAPPKKPYKTREAKAN